MPLLRRQPFARQKPASELKPEEEVFFCRLTGEVFKDYEKFFERIILCNSLVWTCEITGKSGLTYQEAVECEEKALKQLASFPDYLQRPILYLATLTHRTRVNDLNDDVFTYAKDRYFIGEHVEVVQAGEKKSCKVIQVIAPTPKPKTPSKPSTPVPPECNGTNGSDTDSDVICLDDPVPPPKKSPSKPPKSPKAGSKEEQKLLADANKPIDPEKYQYVVQEMRKSNIYIVEAKCVSRKKGLYSRDKGKLFLKQHSDNLGDGIWKIKEKYVQKFKLADVRFIDFFEGPSPRFGISIAKKKPAAKSSNVIDLTDEDTALAKAKKAYKEKKKEKKLKDKESKKKKKEIPGVPASRSCSTITQSSSQVSLGSSPSLTSSFGEENPTMMGITSIVQSDTEPKSAESSKSGKNHPNNKSKRARNKAKKRAKQGNCRKITDFMPLASKSEGDLLVEKPEQIEAVSLSKSEGCLSQMSDGTEEECLDLSNSKDNIEDVDVVEEKPAKLTLEERAAIKEQIRVEKLAEKLAKKEEMKKFMEEERQKKKEERDKEKMKKLEEKIERDRLMKEWSRPREDMECDDLKDMPVPTPVNCHVPSELVGDVLMILEYTMAFNTLFNWEDDFPDGFTFEDLGRAVMSTDTNGLFADMIRVLLVAVFNLQEEEDEEDEDVEGTNISEPFKGLQDEGGSVSYKQLVSAATVAALYPQVNLGAPLKKLQLDGFTMTEIVRLHFLSSGAKASDNSCQFRFQQRGGYTSLDDPGLEFRKEEPAIIKALQSTNLFDLSAADKLKIITALINQLLTFVTSRDFMEDNYERLRQIKSDVRVLQSEELKRERDESAFWYKKRMEEKQKVRELEAEKKAQNKKEKEDKLRAEEGTEGKPIDIGDEDSNDKDDKEKEDDKNKEPERKSSRQIAKLVDKEDKEDLPVENIDWEKITPEQRVRMKERFYKKEKELSKLIYELAHGNAIYSLGRDRTFRRYWGFRAVPGVFVEDNEEYIPDDFLQPIEQTGSSNPFQNESTPTKDNTASREEKNNSSDKENESFESPNGSNKNCALTNNTLGVTAENKSNVTVNGIPKEEVNVEISESRDGLIFESVGKQIENRNTVQWAYFSTPEQVDKVISSLNPRGIREGPLKQALMENKQRLTETLDKCPLDMLSINKSAEGGSMTAQAVSIKLKSRNKTTQGTVKNTSAQEFIELNLRESLLDIEERIFVGTLGSVKVKDRNSWRDAIENGSYDQQCGALQWSGKPDNYSSPSKNGLNDETGMEVDDEASPVVRDLAKALLQIAQGLEVKYVGQPLGEAVAVGKKKNSKQAPPSKAKGGSKDKAKGRGKKDDSDHEEECDKEDEESKSHKSSFQRWYESLMACTSLPQIFLHLSILESSIVWAKSSLHARCRLCRRKGDGEHMLLCDGCDRGHHMYCLKPQVKKVPQGDWFCSDCRPKEVPRTPRKRRKSFYEEDEEKAESEEEESSDDSDESGQSDDSEVESGEEKEEGEESEDDSDEDSETSEEEEEEEEVQPVKIRIIKKVIKKQPASGRSTPSSETGRKGLKPSNSRSSLENGRPAKGKGAVKGGRNSLEPPKAKQSRKSLEPSRGRKSEEPERPLKTGRRSLDPKGLRGSRSTSSLHEMATAGAKRKADLIDDAPDTKKAATSKSRGGESGQQMKMIEDLLNELADRKEAWPFLTPVTKRDAPDYFDIVRKPMDFRTIRSKILKIEYLEVFPIIEDIRLTFTNCQQYNMPTAPEFSAGQKMARYFEKRLKELKLNTLSNPKATKSSPSPKKKQRKN